MPDQLSESLAAGWERAPGGIDATIPNPARVYDYLLGGCFL